MRTPRRPVFEVCVESVPGAAAAELGGADRIELCASLCEGGLTPSLGALRTACQQLHIPVFAMIRPRGGDFLLDPLDVEVMERDIAAAREAGAAGVVLGALRADGTVDRDTVRRLAGAARPLEVTFHRAFDMARDPSEALEVLIELDVERVLTSGCERSAREGAARIAQLVERAGDRIAVMPGGGIRSDHARELVERTGARELHFTAGAVRDSAMEFRNPRPAIGSARDEFAVYETDAEAVRALVRAFEN